MGELRHFRSSFFDPCGLTVWWLQFGILGFILTYVFLPDTTGLDLKEQERYFSYVKAGRADEYHGIAVHPRHLSWW